MNYDLSQFSTATLYICLFLSLLYYVVLLWSWSYRKSNQPAQAPVPAGSWPIIGHLHLLRGPDPPHVTLGNMAEKYGPVFTIWIGLRRALVVSSWEVAKECFTTNDKVFSSRPSSVAAKHMAYDQAMFGIAPYGSYWRELRKIVNHELLSNSKLQLLKHKWDSEINTSVQELYGLYLDYKNNKHEAGHGVLVDMKRWFADLSLNISVKMVAGKRIAFSSSSVGGESSVKRHRKAIREFFRLIGIFVLSDAIPFLQGWVDFGGYEQEMKRNGKELDDIMEEWLEEHKVKNKRSLKSGDDGLQDEQNFMDAMLAFLLGDKNNLGRLSDSYIDDDTINKSTCLSLILGGSEAIMIMLIWAVSLLLNHRFALEKVRDELDVHVSKERQVDESDIKNLPYLQAVVKETMRLYASPLLPPRESTEDCMVGGYYVPAGTRLFINTREIQRDPRVWSNPSEFHPERFLSGNQVEIDVGGQSFELIPFGSGRRICPGVSFSLQVVHLALARLVHGFDLQKPSDAPIDMTESVGFTNVKATPLEVILIPRLSSELYIPK